MRWKGKRLFGGHEEVVGGGVVPMSGVPGPEQHNSPRHHTTLTGGSMNPAFQSTEHIDAEQGGGGLMGARTRSMSVVDPAPRIDHYRVGGGVTANGVITRPSLQDLHQEKQAIPDYILDSLVDMEKMGEEILEKKPPVSQKTAKKDQHVKFGWIVGVLVRCVLNILGAMLYLRLTWMAGQCGMALATVIVLLSSVVTTLTSLSMCAICTNGEIRGGGAYFMLSRALGPEFGGSMGFIFSLANALGAAMHATGFSETVRDLMKENGAKIVDSGANDIRILSLSTLCILMCIVIMGVDFEVKAQLVLLVILVISYFNYIVGTVIPPTDFKMARGMTGYSWKTFTDNIVPGWRGESFFSVFSIYFPAATGIMAGANISGDLKDPGVAIPKGTLLAILLTTLIYLGGIWMSGATIIRDASGDYNDLIHNNLSACADNGTCKYGLMNYFQTMEMESGFGPLITAGIFAATLSSALACLVSGPKLFQAVGRDNLFPRIDWFAKGYGKSDEPRRAYFLGFVISLAMACVGDLNTIAPFISNFYLATYTLINFACFHGSLAKSPGWRPAFKYYNKWLSLLGAALCIACMFLMSWIAALLTYAFIIALYIYLLRRKPDVNWGSSNQAHQYKLALQSMLKLMHTEDHVKNFRPQILALTGNPVARPSMVDFIRGITRHHSLLLLGHVTPPLNRNEKQHALVRRMVSDMYDWMAIRRVKGFYCPVAASNLRDGFRILLQVAGLGKLRPNIVILGYKNCWRECSADEIDHYFQLIHDCFDADMAVGVLRVAGGLDFSDQMLEAKVGDTDKLRYSDPTTFDPPPPAPSNPPPVFELSVVKEETERELRRLELRLGSSTDDDDDDPLGSVGNIRYQPSSGGMASSAISTPTLNVTNASGQAFTYDSSTPNSPNVNTSPTGTGAAAAGKSPFSFSSFRFRRLSKVQRDVLASIDQFQTKFKKAVIDVWWLFDDGGLTLLIPHLLSVHKTFMDGAKLRVFVTASNGASVAEEQKKMLALLQKFRINCTDVTIVTDMNQPPTQETVGEFDTLIAPFRISASDGFSGKSATFVTDTELTLLQDRTNRHLRTHELLMKHSHDSSLVVVTLPVPRKGGVSACLYLSWLEMLTKDLPQVLLVRGNQQSVLTFYS